MLPEDACNGTGVILSERFLDERGIGHLHHGKTTLDVLCIVNPLRGKENLGFIGTRPGIADEIEGDVFRNFMESPAQLILGDINPAGTIFFDEGSGVIFASCVKYLGLPLLEFFIKS